MRLLILSPGRKMPGWLAQGWETYARRMPAGMSLDIVTVPAGRERQGSEARARRLQHLSRAMHRVAVHPEGAMWSTADLARQLRGWQRLGRDIALLIGGAEGLDARLLAMCDQSWSLGPLTFPHQLVRLLVAEQLYRAATILHGHPYHRA